MTISSSLNAGVAGLQANATRLASISDNIANSSTFGYKRVQTDFESMVISRNGGNYSAGGVRAETSRQIGLNGTLVSTSNSTDLAVRGRGMLPVAKMSDLNVGNGGPNMLLTSTGSFTTNAEGFLTTGSGLVLLGWPAGPDGSIPVFPRDTAAGLQPIQINLNQLDGEPTTRVQLGLNLPATSTIAGSAVEPEQLVVEYYGNLGTSDSVNVTFTPSVPATGATNEWTMTLTDSVTPGVVIGEYIVTFSDTQAEGGSLASVTTVSGGAYDPVTGSFIVDVAGGPMEIDIGLIGQSDGLTQLSDTFVPFSIKKDGSPVGNMTSINVDSNGYVNVV
jgi:flagellar hook protein FlgE